jgi:hemerythrin-like metal-binding protein
MSMTIPEGNEIITGDPKLDFEHAQIFATLGRLQDPGLSQAIRIASCERLLHYISEHCKDEEDLMKAHAFPDIEVHLEAHRDLQEAFLKRLSSFIRCGGIVGDEIKAIFYSHIINVDIPMIAYIRHENKLDDEKGT